ncbi:hypothetical protein IQ22_03004 [Pseudomonas duriflava]|uniref:Uncharacterized protein n=1 Tax=Pseudomonas duriflava TaxID=459528 RepID=A0A562Q8S2_9PSED|nr:hypothetical protein [Pseudomonas duriflava]TWI53157.1 hypothetical protein IQ22_03004 [Pseudomonas duriflava]
MAIKHFEHFEAISSAVPADEGFDAVIGVKARTEDSPPRFHRVATERHFDLASEAEEAADAALSRVAEIAENGDLIWEESLS